MNRRRIPRSTLFMVVLSLFTSIPGITLHVSSSTAQTSNLIVVENQQVGSAEWQLGRSGFLKATDTGKQIKGYASTTSVNKGESIDLHVTVAPAQAFTVDIYRLGSYGGTGGRLMQRIGPLPGVQQPACPVDSVTGLAACDWSIAHTLTIPTTWTTGVYVRKRTNEQNYQSQIMFVVRDDARTPQFLYQQAVTTYQAYNNYPNESTIGKSLYEHNSKGANTVVNTPRAVKVSFDQPYAGNELGQFLKWEHNFVRWME